MFELILQELRWIFLPWLLSDFCPGQWIISESSSDQHCCLQRWPAWTCLQDWIPRTSNIRLPWPHHSSGQQHDCRHSQQQRTLPRAQAQQLCWLQPLPHFLQPPICPWTPWCQTRRPQEVWVQRWLPQLCKFTNKIFTYITKSC